MSVQIGDQECLAQCLVSRALDGLSVGLILTDPQDVVVWMNRAAREMLRLDRDQATADTEAVDRFQREAKASAALNHPNIITVHEIDEFEGQIFLVMEHVDGTSLRERISGGPLSMGEVVKLAGQICEGLGKAHRVYQSGGRGGE